MHELNDGTDEERAPAESLPDERPHDEPPREEKPVRESSLYLKLLLLLAGTAYAIAFVLQNNEQVDVDFVFAKTQISLTWVILISLAIGLLGGVLLSQLYRRRRRRH
jgi:uncharacterized integral membrane protein